MLWVRSLTRNSPEAGARRPRPVRAVVIGAGTFGRGVVVQGARAPDLEISALVDTDVEAAADAFAAAGFSPDEVTTCETPADARAAIAAGRRVVTADVEVLLDGDIDVLVEATGHAAAGARHARLAIAHGKHVAMVTKEADAAVGPILRQRADRAGLAYIPVDGDQHGLLIGLVRWARSVGLDVLCGGKTLDGELVTGRTSPQSAAQSATLSAACFVPAAPGADLRTAVVERTARLGPAAGAKPWDLTELCIAANATGLVPDRPGLHCPALWTSEIPAALCPEDLGGLLGGSGIIDAVQVVRGSHEVGLGGGVFVVVRVPAAMGKSQFHTESTTSTTDGPARIGLVTHPQHLLGIEAISSILAAALAGPAAGADDYRPRVDVVYRAVRTLRADDVVGHDHCPELTAELVEARPLAPATPLPAGLATGNRLCHDVPAGALITAAAVTPPPESDLWDLRAEQDRSFFG
ncbi:MAG TPA: hypothetical protein VE287_01995 [Actinopolymorphaceae bacterium]|nr:hypothetical protein [Actinopolymorphaceae bacterium]